MIGDDGRVALWCPRCVTGTRVAAAPARAAVTPTIMESTAPRRLGARIAMPAIGIAVAFAAVMSSAAVTVVERGAPASGEAAAAGTAAAAAAVPLPAPVAETETATETVAEAEAVAETETEAEAETVAEAETETDAETDAETVTEPQAIDLVALEDERPTLHDWVHPVTGTTELTPARSTRKFGAHRDGVSDPGRCGQGHCGVDLAGPRGRPVVAVAWGTVVRVEHSTRGRDGRSGRYVRIEHPERVFTAYMHLDEIAAELKVGDEVTPGQLLGTLGKTGIYSGEQHLHFALEIEIGGALRYLDPSPFLAHAEVAPIPVDELRLAPDQRAQW